jgi:N6-L-threonylcarbamoyladenine synthase
MLVLGIETTCDETAAALVERDADGNGAILANIVLSQIADHAAFGGVVPEIAARAHVEALDVVIATAMADAGKSFAALDGVAAAAGPGLIGGVIVGLTTGKAIAMVHEKPLIAVNHLEAHALTARLTDAIPFPYCLFLASGGHTQIVAVRGVGDYVRLGTTRDDAIGEAFDKTAKLLGLGYPGGPRVEEEAQRGDRGRFLLPRPMIGRHDADFSLSGLKTAVRLEAEKIAPLSQTDVADLCASFQFAVIEMVVDRLQQGLRLFRQRFGVPSALVAAGGVAANQPIREALLDIALQHQLPLAVPPPALCGDNAAIVAWAGAERLAHGLCDALDVAPRPRWPLDEVTRPVMRMSAAMPASPKRSREAPVAIAEADNLQSLADSIAVALEAGLAAAMSQKAEAQEIEAQEPDAAEMEPQESEAEATEAQDTEPPAIETQAIEPREAGPQAIEAHATEPQETDAEETEPQEIEVQAAEPSETEAQEIETQTAEPPETESREIQTQATDPPETEPQEIESQAAHAEEAESEPGDFAAQDAEEIRTRHRDADQHAAKGEDPNTPDIGARTDLRDAEQPPTRPQAPATNPQSGSIP